MKLVFLALAIVGAIVPYVFFLQFFGAEGMALQTFISALFVNGAAAGFTADLLISSLAFWLSMILLRGRGQGPHPMPFVLINLLIGLSCALPLYLYFTAKER